MRIFSLLLSALCTRPPFIKNSNLPSCANCVHFLKYKNGEPHNINIGLEFDLGKCSQFGKKDIISDIITYDYASHCRDDKDQCDKNGKYYISLPTNP